MTDWFEVTTWVRQGCVWSPLLFGIIIDWVLKNSLDKNDLGIVLEKRRSSRYQQQRLSDLDFVDEIALIDESEQRLQLATSKVEEKGRKVGLTINSKKTKVIDVAKERNDITTMLSNQDSLENVDKFVCLWSAISPNGDHVFWIQTRTLSISFLSCVIQIVYRSRFFIESSVPRFPEGLSDPTTAISHLS